MFVAFFTLFNLGSVIFQFNGMSKHKDLFKINEATGVLMSTQPVSSNDVGPSVTLKVDVCDETSTLARCDAASVTISLTSISVNARNLNNRYSYIYYYYYY